MTAQALRDSDDYADDPEVATELWNKGYRPIHAEDVKVGMTVAYRETDFFGVLAVGPVLYARVESVTKDHGLVLVQHTGAPRDMPTECDELEQVWAKVEA